eukprot:5518161-Amphidinium_carterae.6
MRNFALPLSNGEAGGQHLESPSNPFQRVSKMFNVLLVICRIVLASFWMPWTNTRHELESGQSN